MALLAINNIVFAQESILNSISSINISVSPSNPSAGDSVTLIVSSDLVDLNSAKIVWYIDGVARKDTFSKSISIKTKSGGQKTTVRVLVETSDGVIKEVSTEISPTGVDLVIEPMSYTLPFYKGKPLFTRESLVKIVALPDITVSGTKLLAKDLNFRWSKDDYVLGSNSGKGKNSIVINSTIPVRDINVNVQISDVLGNILAEKSKRIVLNDPKILFYENNPLYGVLYNKAVSNIYSLGEREELKVVAKPFSFDFLKDVYKEIGFSWYVNDNLVEPSGKINEVTLRRAAAGKGITSVSLDLSNENKINQYASGGFEIEFGN